MKVVNRFPAYAVRNADFVTRKRQDGKVLDFQVDLETLPAVGMLCVHQNTILAAAKLLGFPLQTDAMRERTIAERIELDELRDENEKLRRVLGILDGIRLTDIEKVETDMAADEEARKKKVGIDKARAARKQEQKT